MLVRACAALVLGVALAPLGPGSAASAVGRGPTATGLTTKDPGALRGHNTVVVATPGERVFGVPRRPNFVAAMGAGATIYGGSRGDELAGRAPRVTLRGRGGRDVLHGGRDGTLIGGPGADLLTATQGGATVRAGAGDVVVLRGRRDRVVCPSRARGVVIRRRSGTKVDPTCRRRGASVRTPEAPSAKAPPARAAQVTGDGSNANPFRAPCDDPGRVDCTVSAFPERVLSGPWANEFVPAYRCPTDHPYMVDDAYGPPFTTWGPGVEIKEDDSLSPIGVSITGKFLLDRPFASAFGGTRTGFPESSATNWLWGGSHWYKVVLHCSSNKCHGRDNVGAPPGCGSGGQRQVADRGRVHG
jgi:hypothetical protein